VSRLKGGVRSDESCGGISEALDAGEEVALGVAGSFPETLWLAVESGEVLMETTWKPR
jgi:hypothetical protein